ncbi:2-oxo acid dehydrogenase subunit E2 [Rubinisphaera margarita]|uniref:2-oxo acid dehydrogenase subunit E2 n=1 Tax=Rubinisphaera margarita TaxID=2909586 RepID=UPI001EE7E931|nr:2-oxo acid dehydrogenase subunit E2 [Rubinisphaera margarita]MCG6158523.1 2-oxo acid dehydrogenase subunit E2 [Rubinisphaera margarita]
MPIEFKLPPVSEGVESADIAEIHVSEGDTIEAGQVVAEVETEKALAEIECPHAGTITKVHVSAGDSVPIGSVLLTIDESGSSAGDSEKKEEAPKKEEPKAEEKKEEPKQEQPKKQESKPASAPAQAPAAKAGDSASSNGDRPPAPAGPATRRLARDLGVDLYQVQGSGPGGRISQEDVQNYVKARLSQPAGSGGGGGPATAPPLPDFGEFGSTRREALNKIGKTAAQHLTMSWNVIPHVTQHDLADITDIEMARKQFLQGTGKNGPKVTMTAIAVKAVVTALKTFPKFNSSLDPETNEIVYKEYYNIGIAVDTENGLVVPVVRDADKKSLLQIALEVTDLAIKARDRKLSMTDMKGGTFTITNLGGIGGTAFTPIVSYPEVAILGMSRGQKELKLIDGELEERLILPLSMSYDHRVINGADAARFIVKLSALLSDPFTLLSEC